MVIVPELERKAPPVRSRLLDWEEIVGDDAGAAGVVLAPISGKGEDSAALNRWLRGIRSAREKAERRRLFYVACTRARRGAAPVWGSQCSEEGRHETGEREPAGGGVACGGGAFREGSRRAAWGQSRWSRGSPLAATAEVEETVEERPAMLERFPLASIRWRGFKNTCRRCS